MVAIPNASITYGAFSARCISIMLLLTLLYMFWITIGPLHTLDARIPSMSMCGNDTEQVANKNHYDSQCNFAIHDFTRYSSGIVVQHRSQQAPTYIKRLVPAALVHILAPSMVPSPW